jgi:DNA-directed RNA polymerase subunit RPC12/RpoP
MFVKAFVEETQSAKPVRGEPAREGWSGNGGRYVKCMVCGRRLHVVHLNHLRRHGLTVEEYLSMFPNAKIYSNHYIQSLKKRYWKTIGRKKKRVCVDCGATFTTHAHNKIRCNLCQRIRELEAKKSRERLRRSSWKGVKQILGTKGPSVNFRILPNGRVAAAVWLERNSGKKYKRMFNGGGEIRCPECSSTYLMLMDDMEPYCIECGGRIVLARENEHFTARDLCCSRCGLLYEDPLLQIQQESTSPL